MITIDYKDRRPLYQQIMEKIEDLATQGILQPDEQLPSVRSLAIDLAINPNTIQRAYRELEKKGIIYSVSGRGSFLAKSTDVLVQEKQEDLWQELKKLIILGCQLGVTKLQFVEKVEDFYAQQAQGGENR